MLLLLVVFCVVFCVVVCVVFVVFVEVVFNALLLVSLGSVLVAVDVVVSAGFGFFFGTWRSGSPAAADTPGPQVGQMARVGGHLGGADVDRLGGRRTRRRGLGLFAPARARDAEGDREGDDGGCDDDDDLAGLHWFTFLGATRTVNRL